MADSRCFVQFSHPGGEHEPDLGRRKAWNSYRYPHRRKFMELRGEWLAANDSRQTGDLRAWGEWEPESDLVRTFRPRGGRVAGSPLSLASVLRPEGQLPGTAQHRPVRFRGALPLLELRPVEQARPAAPRRRLRHRVRERYGGRRRTKVDARYRARGQGPRRIRSAPCMRDARRPGAGRVPGCDRRAADRQRPCVGPGYVHADADTAPALPWSNPERPG